VKSISREDRIKQRAHEIWEREGRPEGRQQEHWDQAVQEIESEGSETERGPVTPDPAVGVGSDPVTNSRIAEAGDFYQRPT
jgi:hypothetical protein